MFFIIRRPVGARAFGITNLRLSRKSPHGCTPLCQRWINSCNCTLEKVNVIYDTRHTHIQSEGLKKVGDTFRSAIWKKQNLRLIQSDQRSDVVATIDMLSSAIWQWQCHWYIQIGFGYVKLQSKLIRCEGPCDAKIEFYTPLIWWWNCQTCCLCASIYHYVHNLTQTLTPNLILT